MSEHRTNFLRGLIHRMDFTSTYPGTEDRDSQMDLFTQDLVRVTHELQQVDGVGSVEGSRRVFEVEDSIRVLVRGEVQITELAYTSASSRAILELLEIGFMFNVERRSWVAEGML